MKKKEEKQGVVVIDCGIGDASFIGPMSFCCGNVFMPYRGG